MSPLIFLSAICLLAIFYSLSVKGVFQRIITIVLASFFLLRWTGWEWVYISSIIVTALCSATLVIYGIMHKHMNVFTRLSVLLMGVFFSLSLIVRVQHYIGESVFTYLPAIPIALFMIGYFTSKSGRPKEFSFMMIFISMSVLDIVQLLQ